MNLNNILRFLQTRSHQTKTNIIIGVSALAFIGLGSAWVNTLQSQLVGIGKDDVLLGTVAGSALSAEHRVLIEAAENKDGKTYLYFKVTNDTSDILDFSDRESISLNSGDVKANPEKVQNRQGSDFSKKVLSNDTVYGILIFQEITTSSATLTFDQLYFEQTPGQVFKEVLEIDLDQLQPIEELRS